MLEEDRLPQKRGRGRPKARSDDEQAAAIVTQARALFLAGGYGRTTMDEIAAACRISKRTLYRLFPAKIDLFAAIVEEHRFTMLALPGDYDQLSLIDAIAAIFRVDIGDAENQERMALVGFVLAEIRQFPELGNVVRIHGADPSRAELTAWLARQAERGRIRLANPEYTARMLMDLIFGAVPLKQPGLPDWPRETDRRNYLREAIRLIVEGMMPR
ncbi:TetR/AcrR family transcriptional regulator [Ancylobacter defluvii]|uniref:TetR family transcriptional regulator n=1 Tax=Ancylobacter defluvii TaxID=1282440 RepID=A0A9W6JX77_9HYPH|nr:TetR/AcrR family transcriptional regulator [Ancylobacter defluvii]MBS7587238.1 TetR/AcrR family transcriptional regulator [Ancylobacter defluvii]GLK83554.1 TetR family transcriptional regulator [Ancylobacter defluvii]